jgi:Raf kinase inhibitor-like YbhB/YbcL family protein
MQVTSSAIGTNGSIPIEFTADGDNIAPPLAWSDVPEGTKSIAIVVDDPDSPAGFVHWVAVGIPPTCRELSAGGALPEGAMHGRNDRGSIGWTGPNPPNGRHRYVFHVYATDVDFHREGVTKQDVMSALKGHILDQGELVATYEKRAPRSNMPPSSGTHTGQH